MSDAAVSAERTPYVAGTELYVDGKPFLIRGVCYSPVPIGGTVDVDYFTEEYAPIFKRDLPLLKAMGANTIRVYHAQPGYDHSAFLREAEANGLKVVLTFFLGNAFDNPVASEADRARIYELFASEVRRHRQFPAVLAWIFGNELNGKWNSFLEQLNTATGETPCGWDDRFLEDGGCIDNFMPAPQPGDRCYEPTFCVYSRLFSFIDNAAKAAKAEANVLVTSAFADLDHFEDKIKRAGSFASNLDFWSSQVYRGPSFGSYFAQMNGVTDKPVLITEYGVDAYHDVCGLDLQSPCYNVIGDDTGSFEDGATQASYAVNLTLELQALSSLGGECSANGVDPAMRRCQAIGGFIMAWVDEFWKGSDVQSRCHPTIREVPPGEFSARFCDFKAHVTCPNMNASEQDICGYVNGGAPDSYVNEQWFGLTSPTKCPLGADKLRPREAYWRLRQVWTGDDSTPAGLFPECEKLQGPESVGGALDGSTPQSHLGKLAGGGILVSFVMVVPWFLRGRRTRREHEGQPLLQTL